MPQFACLNENNVIVETLILSNDDCFDENQQLDLTKALLKIPQFTNVEGNWVIAEQKDENGGNTASTGRWYIPEHNIFVEPKTQPSWVINASTRMWEPPIPRPSTGDTREKMWSWDESQVNWVLIDVPENNRPNVDEALFN